MNRVIPAWTAVMLAVGAAGGRADPPTDPPDAARFRRLIDRLGNPDYEVREAASRELAGEGIGAKPFVLDALRRNPNAEIRARCLRVLPRIDFNICWEGAKPILGDTPAARAQFVDCYCAEKDLWYAHATGAVEFGSAYTTRCLELLNGPPVTGGRAPVPPATANDPRFRVTDGSLASFLILGAEYRSRIPADGLRAATQLFRQRWGGRYAAEKDTPPPLRKSYVVWAEEIDPLPIQYDGEKRVELARAALRSKTVPASQRQYSLLTVSKIRDKRDDALIGSYLTDATVCDTLFTKGVKTQVQLRDIALAATIYRAGKDPMTFGFTNLKSDPDLIYRPSSLGFAGDAARAEAFRAWNDAVGMPR